MASSSFTTLAKLSAQSSIPESVLRKALVEFRKEASASSERKVQKETPPPEDAVLGSEDSSFIRYLKEHQLRRAASEIIDGFSVGGFKAYEDDQKIDFAPITLIFGPNSCGKSSLLHSYLLGNDMLESGNISVESPSLARGQISLGGPQSFINGFKLRLRYSLMLLDGIDVEYSFLDTSEALNPGGGMFFGLKHEEYNYGKYPEWSEKDIPVADRYFQNEAQRYFCFSASNTPLIEYSAESEKIIFNLRHPLVLKKIEQSNLSQVQITRLSDGFSKFARIKGYELIIDTSGDIDLDLFLNPFKLMLKECIDMIRRQYRRVKFLGPYREPKMTPWIEDFSMKDSSSSGKISHEFNLEIANITLAQLQIPYQLEVDISYSLMANDIQKLTEEINSGWKEQRWNHIDDYASSAEYKEGEAIEYSVRELLSMSDVTKRIFLVGKDRNVLVKTKRFKYSDVGFGISQVMPVVLNSLFLTEHTILIEQPELHVHPAIQTELGDLFIQSALGENNNRFLLETHSEHLILRLLRRIRQTTENDPEYPEDLPKIKPEDVAVYYAEKTDRGTQLRRLRISPDGDFIDPWPKGFFTERGAELF